MEDSSAGIFIAVEGVDGAGKTTLVDRLCTALSAAGETVVRTKEPTDGQYGAKIRESATTGRMDLESELQAFIDDRHEHVAEVIAPALERGEVVIVDRYFYSTIAYQGERGADVDQLTRDMRSQFPIPDVVLLLDADPSMTLLRVSESRGDTPNEFERQGALEKIREIFLALRPECPEIRVIDAASEADEVYRDAAHVLLDTAIKNKRSTKAYSDAMFVGF